MKSKFKNSEVNSNYLNQTQFQLKSTQMFISQMTFLNLKFEDFKTDSSLIDLIVEDVVIFIKIEEFLKFKQKLTFNHLNLLYTLIERVHLNC